MKSLKDYIFEYMDDEENVDYENLHLTDIEDDYEEVVVAKTKQSIVDIAKYYKLATGEDIRCIFKHVFGAEDEDVAPEYPKDELNKMLNDKTKYYCEIGFSSEYGEFINWALFDDNGKGKCIAFISAECYSDEENVKDIKKVNKYLANQGMESQIEIYDEDF